MRSEAAGMDVEKAIDRVRERFPFKRYFEEESAYQAERARFVMRYLPPGSRILDFGAGPASLAGVLQTLGYRCSVFDDLRDHWHLEGGAREKILRYAEDVGIAFNGFNGERMPYAPASFEMVAALGVVEHLHDSPRDLVNDLVSLLVPGGYLMIEVPNLVNIRKRISVLLGKTNLPSFDYYYWYPGPWRGHVREYVKGDLVRLARYAGVETVELRACDRMLDKVPRRLRPIYRAVTRMAPGWRDCWLLLGRKPETWRPRKELPESEFRALLEPLGVGAHPE